MTDSVDDVEQARLDRIARLTARRPAPGPAAETRAPSARQRRRHPAQGARIVAASLGATTMFGIVTVLGLANAGSTQSAAAATPTTVPIASPTPAARVIHAPSVPAVIVLNARPVVQVVAPAPTQRASANPAPPPAAVATTRGSS